MNFVSKIFLNLKLIKIYIYFFVKIYYIELTMIADA